MCVGESIPGVIFLRMKNKKTLKDGLIEGEGLVLVVDDEPIMRKIAVNVLKNSGYDVMAASSGSEAVDIFKRYHREIKLVILDLLMPGKSGEETYMELKEIQTDVNVLLVSGARKDKRVRKVLKEGIKGFIEKPYTFPQLSGAVFELIHGQDK
jgi:CheY-like chemotaxis protein